MTDVFIWHLPFEKGDEFRVLHQQSRFFFHFADNRFDDGFPFFNMAAGKIDAWPVIFYSVFHQKRAIRPIKHAHVGQNRLGTIAHEVSLTLFLGKQVHLS